MKTQVRNCVQNFSYDGKDDDDDDDDDGKDETGTKQPRISRLKKGGSYKCLEKSFASQCCLLHGNQSIALHTKKMTGFCVAINTAT